MPKNLQELGNGLLLKGLLSRNSHFKELSTGRLVRHAGWGSGKTVNIPNQINLQDIMHGAQKKSKHLLNFNFFLFFVSEMAPQEKHYKA